MELVPIVPHLFLVPGANEGRFPFSHCVLADTAPVTLLDVGCGLGILEELLTLASPEQVIVSHSHPDHCSGCHLLEGRPILVPEASADTFGDKDKLAARFFDDPDVGEVWKNFITGAMAFENCRHTGTYTDGAQFRLSEMTFVAIAAPGHSADHMALFEATHGVLLAFDVDLTPFGPWYGHPESDLEAFRRTIRALADLEPRVVVTSHGGIFRRDIQAHFDRYLRVLDARHGAILELVRTGCDTLEKLVQVSPIYRGHKAHPVLTRYWEGQMIQKHLELLEREGRVRRLPDGRYEAVVP